VTTASSIVHTRGCFARGTRHQARISASAARAQHGVVGALYVARGSLRYAASARAINIMRHQTRGGICSFIIAYGGSVR